MIQVWVSILAGEPLNEEESTLLQSVGADQYIKVGVPHDGLELVHCLIEESVVPQVEAFLTARGQEPEIVKASYQDGTWHGFEKITSEEGEVSYSPIEGVTPLASDVTTFNSFFPLQESGTEPIYDEEGNQTGTQPRMVQFPQHQFAGWAI